MAKQTSSDSSFNPQDTSSVTPKRFDGDLQKDVSDYHIKENEWSYARNAINNSNRGDLGMLGNEPANKQCITAPYTIIGFIHLNHDKWAVFSTDNTNSEIGYFQESTCTYAKIVNDQCLNFSTEHLIYGVSREDYSCNHVLYWADGYNVDRFLKIGDIKTAPYSDPWPGVPYACLPPDPQNPQSCNPCVFQEPLSLDCNKLRLETLMRPICMKVSKGALGGELLNGSYFVTAAYTVDGLKVTDYFTPSNVQPLFDHSGIGGSIEVNILDIDNVNFEEFELVVISVVAQQTVAKKLGIYSTRQTNITIDIIDIQLPSVPIEEIPVSNVIYEKSDAMYSVNDYLLRVSPTSKFNFNYQPLANQIRVKWQSVEYPETYYKNGGNNTGYMRDEVYAFFIRWVYNTGDRSASFHIPGRPAIPANDLGTYNTDDAIELPLGISSSNLEQWQVENTATILPGFTSYTLCDGGVVLSEGYMGYWESTEKYPDTKPAIWDASSHTWSALNPPGGNPVPFPYVGTTVSDYDLCGKAIRHHRFPDNDLDVTVSHFRPASTNTNSDTNYIRIMGVNFENIRPPRDNEGNLIPGIVGYEILRGSRKGNRSVIAKGIINNMVEYNLNITNSTQTGLFQNYPYNDLRGDRFLSETETRTNPVNITSPLGTSYFDSTHYKQNIFSFHSPETNFANPYLSPIELKTYQDLFGIANMRYQYPAKHPKQIFTKDLALFLSLLGGIGLAIYATKGKKSKSQNLGITSLLSSSFVGPVGVGPNPLFAAALAAAGVTNNAANIALSAYNLTPAALLESLTGLADSTVASGYGGILQGIISASAAAAAHGIYTTPTTTAEYGQNDYIPPSLNIVASLLPGNLPTFLYYLTQGADQIYSLIVNASRVQQHALQAISNCNYNDYTPRIAGQRRRIIRNSGYVDNQLQDFGTRFKINNLYRGRFVALELTANMTGPATIDTTRYDARLQDLPGGQEIFRNPERSFTRVSSTYYSALKQRLRNQYGQLESIVQLPISCTVTICPASNGRHQYQVPNGFRINMANAPLICDNNLVTNPQFIDASGNPDFTDWSSDPTSVWQAGVYNGETVATNTGGTFLIQPNAYPELVQYFNTPIQNGKPLSLSFDVKRLPPGYSVEVYLGSALTPLVTVNAVGSYSTPTVPIIITPVTGVLDRIRFRSIPAILPVQSSATIKSEGPYGLAGQTWFAPALTNIVNNAANLITQGSAYLIDGPQPLTPKTYDHVNSYISNLDCVSRISWDFNMTGQGYLFNPSGNTVEVTLNRLTSSDPVGYPGTPVATLINTNIGVGYITLSNTGSAIINSVDPTDRYVIFVKCWNVNFTVQGATITVDKCITQDTVSITNVCFTLPASGAGYGCTDSTAANYDSNATTDNGTCVYYGCTDPDAANYCPDCIACPNDDNRCECIYNSTDPLGPPSINPGTGYCNWNCHPAVSNPASYNSYVMFGGDVYIGRYTEKNSFFYFFDWMYGQPDRYEWDYLKYRMIAYPTYWFNSGGMSPTESISSAWETLTDVTGWGSGMFANIINPSDFHCLDRPNFQFGLAIKLGYIYLFNSGIRDFFVESEYNVDLRDFGDVVTERHYDPTGRNGYTDTSAMFEAGVIKAGNYYKYDNSLSISKIWYSYVGWGSIYQRSYDPNIAETCYQYRPNRILYSLPVQTESVRDNWRIFLSNNYKDFISRVLVVKQINKSGAVILFESDSPVMFQGTDQLQTDLGTKLTIGDGGLFSQPMQSLMNADRPYEYGSCQNRLSVINTPVGTFWINQNQGKIFHLSSGLTEITMANLKWWFAQFMPYQLTKYFPDYALNDNPVAGIGCQTIYDNTNNLVYFTKKDYKPVLNNDGTPKVSYDATVNKFYINVGTAQVYVDFTNDQYFEPASWTVSYDVKTKAWVSFHDWHPDLTAPGKNTFMTTKDDGVWVHNQRCDLYANYYGINYPFEIEYLTNTVQIVNTLRSIEYQLEVYKYKYDNCYDRFHVLDFNFDEAVIYNTEQCSGLLKLNLTPKNNAPLLVQYPQINNTNIQILYSKEENKYRFNQFWDATKDRGEFDWIVNNTQTPPVPGALDYPPVPTTPYPGGNPPGTFRQQTIWNTEPNGYIKTLNAFNLSYNKSQLQRKKFRHYTTSVLLRRKVSGNKKMLVSITNNKNLLSPR